MGYWSVAALLVSVSFLAYKNPPKTWKPWNTPQEPKTKEAKSPPNARRKEYSDDNTSGGNKTDGEAIFTLEGDLEGTPKAAATNPKLAVPTFSLSSNNKDDDEEDEPEAPSFPAANSAQRASSSPSPSFAMPPPPRPTNPTPPSASSLMPPPARPTPRPGSHTPSTLRAPLSPLPNRSAANLLPNRGPPPNSAQRVGNTGNTLLPTNSTAIKTPNPRAKVQLAPGHSPMDWAALTTDPSVAKTLTGLPPGTLLRVTPSALRTQTGRKGKPAWSSWQGKVYNITPYLPYHPGGEAELLKAAGRDGTKLFMEVHPWVNWENMLGGCLVGVLVSEGEGGGGASDLEEMD